MATHVNHFLCQLNKKIKQVSAIFGTLPTTAVTHNVIVALNVLAVKELFYFFLIQFLRGRDLKPLADGIDLLRFGAEKICGRKYSST